MENKIVKVKDWIALNKDLCTFRNFNIIVFKKGNFKTDDIIIKAACEIDVCASFFGNFDMFGFRMEHSFFENGNTITFLTWPDEEI